MWLGNLIWPSGANLTEWSWDMSGSRLLIRGGVNGRSRTKRQSGFCDGKDSSITTRPAYLSRPTLLPYWTLLNTILTPFFPAPLISPLTSPFSSPPSLLSCCPLVHGQITEPAAPIHLSISHFFWLKSTSDFAISYMSLFFLFSHLSCQVGKDPGM